MTSSTYTGADLIADFIAERCCGTAFLVTGGACAFIVDAIGRSPKTEFVCFQHEQAAAMAADAISVPDTSPVKTMIDWRVLVMAIA